MSMQFLVNFILDSILYSILDSNFSYKNFVYNLSFEFIMLLGIFVKCDICIQKGTYKVALFFFF